MAKQSSGFLACRPYFSVNTQPLVDSCETAPVLADASANACPEVQSSPYDNVVANTKVPPAAATEKADRRRYDAKTVPSASTPLFQASTSHEVSSSSAEGVSTFALSTPASGAPSSRFPMKSGVIKNIRKAAAVDKENGKVNLEGLVQHISELLELIKGFLSVRGQGRAP